MQGVLCSTSVQRTFGKYFMMTSRLLGPTTWSLMRWLVCIFRIQPNAGLTAAPEPNGHGQATPAPRTTTLNTIETSERTMHGPYAEETDDGIETMEFRNKFKDWKPRDIDQAFREHQIVPDVVDDPPVNMSKILFPLNRSPEFGNEMDVKFHTHIDWAQWPGSLNDTYTLIYTIPDVPTRNTPTHREYQVWVVGNIEGPIYIQNQTLTEYVQPKQINGTGLHRHVFLVYKQPYGRLIAFDEPYLDDKTRDDSRRYNFSTRAFAKKYNLGKPAAGNFFLAY